MSWFAYLFILIGALLLILIPFMVHTIKHDPLSVLRPQWRDRTTMGFATVFGTILIIIALVGGLATIFFGFSLLRLY